MIKTEKDLLNDDELESVVGGNMGECIDLMKAIKGNSALYNTMTDTEKRSCDFIMSGNNPGGKYSIEDMQNFLTRALGHTVELFDDKYNGVSVWIDGHQMMYNNDYLIGLVKSYR